MGRIPESVIEEVLDRADIVETVRNYVRLEQAGSNWKGLCPFHDDHDPSLKVHEGKQIYKCFACGAGGNSIGFVMEMEGWSFPEAVRQLAERNGVDVPEQDDEAAERARERRDQKQRYFEIMEMAGEFFRSNLWDDPGRSARHYLEERGLDEETARDFGLGYAPDAWEQLLGHLTSQGVEPDEAEAAGLVLARNNSPGHYDRFRHRIVFPVVDIWRNIRAFGGRTLAEDDDTPKYMNSPETPFYTKGDHLYGLHVAKRHFGEDDYALLVEGNFDVLALHAAGFRTTVAPMGTALTTSQADLLARYADRVIIAFDGDEAGQKATRKCLPALQHADLQGRVVEFDALDDPDNFVRREGADALRQRIEDAPSLIDWSFDQIIGYGFGDDIDDKLRSLEQASKVVSEVRDKEVRQYCYGELERRLNVDEDTIEKYVANPESREALESVRQAQRPEALEKAEYGLLAVLLQHPEWLDHFLEEELTNLLTNERLAEFFHKLNDHLEEREELEPAFLLESVDDPGFRTTVASALDPGDEFITDDPSEYYRDCLKTLKRQWADRVLEDVQARLERLDFQEDREEFERLNTRREQLVEMKQELGDTSELTAP